jgi:WD40 repeat protein
LRLDGGLAIPGRSLLAFGANGGLLAAAGGGSTIRVLNPLSADAARSAFLRGHSNSVLALAISPDGQKLASGSNDGTVRLWDLGRVGELPVLREGRGPVAFRSGNRYTRHRALRRARLRSLTTALSARSAST